MNKGHAGFVFSHWGSPMSADSLAITTGSFMYFIAADMPFALMSAICECQDSEEEGTKIIV
jgi:hypothetical protein